MFGRQRDKVGVQVDKEAARLEAEEQKVSESGSAADPFYLKEPSI
jgi:uncharacterized small protein (DUF1192 family)